MEGSLFSQNEKQQKVVVNEANIFPCLNFLNSYFSSPRVCVVKKILQEIKQTTEDI